MVAALAAGETDELFSALTRDVNAAISQLLSSMSNPLGLSTAPGPRVDGVKRERRLSALSSDDIPGSFLVMDATDAAGRLVSHAEAAHRAGVGTTPDGDALLGPVLDAISAVESHFNRLQ